MKFILEIELGEHMETLGDVEEAISGTLESAELEWVLLGGHKGHITNRAYEIVGTWEVSQAFSPISPIDPKHLDAVIAGTVPADEGTATLAEREAVERFKASHTIAWQ